MKSKFNGGIVMNYELKKSLLELKNKLLLFCRWTRGKYIYYY